MKPEELLEGLRNLYANAYHVTDEVFSVPISPSPGCVPDIDVSAQDVRDFVEFVDGLIADKARWKLK